MDSVKDPKANLADAKIPSDCYEDVCRTIAECFAAGDIRHRSLEERMEECGGNILHHNEFDWGKRVGREFW